MPRSLYHTTASSQVRRLRCALTYVFYVGACTNYERPERLLALSILKYTCSLITLAAIVLLVTS